MSKKAMLSQMNKQLGNQKEAPEKKEKKTHSGKKKTSMAFKFFSPSQASPQ